MAIINTNNLKQYFLTGLKPTQQQFWNLIDSFRHKNDPVPALEVDGLQDLLDQKLDAELYVDGFNVVRVMQVEETTPEIVGDGTVAVQFIEDDVVNLLFNAETSKYLIGLSEIINTSPLKLKLFNTTQKKTLIADVAAIATNQGQTKITLDPGALVAEVSEGDVLKVEVDFGSQSEISPNKRSLTISMGFLINTNITQDGWYARSATVYRGKHNYTYGLKSNITETNDFADDNHVSNYYDIIPFDCKIKSVWLKTTQNGGSANVDYAVRTFEQATPSIAVNTTGSGVNSKIVARKQLSGGMGARLIEFQDADIDTNYIINKGSMIALYFKRLDANSIPLQGFNLLVELEEILE